jgi:hypothetical protein
VFFGCEAKADEPLVIYIANGAPPPGQPAITNFSSFDFDFTPDQAQAIMGQGFAFATQGIANGTVVRDEDWPACLACAVTDRARNRSGAAREGVCASCFERYCWGAQGGRGGKGNGEQRPCWSQLDTDHDGCHVDSVYYLGVHLILAYFLHQSASKNKNEQDMPELHSSLCFGCSRPTDMNSKYDRQKGRPGINVATTIIVTLNYDGRMFGNHDLCAESKGRSRRREG